MEQLWTAEGEFVVGEGTKNKADKAKPTFGYRVLPGLIGIGNNRVYKGIRTDTNEHIAVKKTMLWSEERSAEGLLKSFENCVDGYTKIAGFSHPNIVKHFGMELYLEDVDGPCSVLLMEYCSGGNLFQKISSMPLLTLDQIKHYARQIISGLRYLHNNGFCHLNLTGANILLAGDGLDTLKICDFGEVVKLQSELRTRSNEVPFGLGTATHMAPEMIDPDHQFRRGRAADVYSFGCVLIEMMTGKRPEYKTANGTVLSLSQQIFCFVASGGGPEIPETPHDLHQLVVQCLHRDPTKRISTGEIALYLEFATSAAAELHRERDDTPEQISTGKLEKMPTMQMQFVMDTDLQNKVAKVRPRFLYQVLPGLIGKGKDPVYAGLRTDTKEIIAVKKILLRSDIGLLNHLEKCVDLYMNIANLAHPNIVRHLGLDIDLEGHDGPYFVLLMEYCSGGSLLQKSRSAARLTLAQIKNYAQQIMTGLQYLYANDVCHLDLKSDNILLVGDQLDTVKICDFGEVVKLESALQVRPGEIPLGVGTVTHMSPEMTDPNNEFRRGRAADVYSFGCVLIEMLTGKLPEYKSASGRVLQTKEQMSYFVMSGGVPEVPELPHDLSSLVRLCLRRDPRDRPSLQEILRHPSLKWDNRSIPDQRNSYNFNLSTKINISESTLVWNRRFLTKSVDCTAKKKDIMNFLHDVDLLTTITQHSHSNVLQFFGVRAAGPKLHAIMEHTSLGSLHDLLKNFDPENVLPSDLRDEYFQSARCEELTKASLKATFAKMDDVKDMLSRGPANRIQVNLSSTPTISTITLLRIALQVCYALEFLEERKIVYCNLSLHTVSISDDLLPKLMTFQCFAMSEESDKHKGTSLYGLFLFSLLRIASVYKDHNRVFSETGGLIPPKEVFHSMCVREWGFPEEIASMVADSTCFARKDSTYHQMAERFKMVRIIRYYTYFCRGLRGEKRTSQSTVLSHLMHARPVPDFSVPQALVLTQTESVHIGRDITMHDHQSQLSTVYPNSRDPSLRIHHLVYRQVVPVISPGHHVVHWSTMSQVAIGIDLGTTNSCVAVFRNSRAEVISNSYGNRTTPSYVTFDDDGTTVGDYSRENWFINPKNTIFGMKRIIGKAFQTPEVQNCQAIWPFHIVDQDGLPVVQVVVNDEQKRYTPVDVSSLILGYLRETAEHFLGTSVTKAVITVPASFTDAQRKATKAAGEKAGLEVIGMINEPTAAALSYNMHQLGNDQKILIFDFGGCTLDVAILKVTNGATRHYDVLASKANMNLGGLDFDEKLLERFIGEFNALNPGLDLRDDPASITRLRLKCDSLKKSLSTNRNSVGYLALEGMYHGKKSFVTKIKLAEFESLCEDIFSRILEPVKDVLKFANLSPSGIDHVVLVGGSSRMRKVKEIMSNYFPGVTVRQHTDGDVAIATGAAIYASLVLSEPSSSPESPTTEILIRVSDMTPRRLAVKLLGGRLETVMPRGTRVPAVATQTYTTSADNQTTVLIEVYEGDAELAQSDNLLGKLTLSGIAPACAGKASIQVEFSYNRSGVLDVTARDEQSGKTVTCSLNSTGVS